MEYELGLVLRSVLQIINSCLSNRLRHNPNLLYTILVEKSQLAPLEQLPQAANEFENINMVGGFPFFPVLIPASTSLLRYFLRSTGHKL
jgi:hypothetical protein